MVIIRASRIDICIIKTDWQGYWYRLIHNKTGIVEFNQYKWERGFNSTEIFRREEVLRKEPTMWNKVRHRYIDKKDMYLSRQDDTHPSFVCYAEVINEVYYIYQQRSHMGVQPINGFYSMYEAVSPKWERA